MPVKPWSWSAASEEVNAKESLMILRHLESPKAQDTSRAAFEVFLESQKNVAPPFGVVLQIAHSELAGELAKALLPGSFGELPPEVAEAAWKHDLGWEASDARQTGSMPGTLPEPFPEVPEDELPSWRESLRLAEGYPALTRVLIGRHFEALSHQPSPRHEEFRATDLQAIRDEEQALGYGEEELKRWAGAVGFVDLLSLVLCSGVQAAATFPIGVHPADPEAETARQVTLTWRDGEPVFSEAVFRPGTVLRVEAQRVDAGSGEVRPIALQWEFRSA
jgi:hypothetical protein